MIRGFSTSFIDLGISDSDSLKQVMAKTGNKTFGRTDCSLPMQWALENGIEIDTFAIFTDNDTWAGREHPHEALNRYRKETGIPARLIVVASAGSWNTIGDPNDAGTLNLSGFDSSAPKVLADFSAGRI
jgi:60 kDa SS-A/Ro ribonucleoprotein